MCANSIIFTRKNTNIDLIFYRFLWFDIISYYKILNLEYFIIHDEFKEGGAHGVMDIVVENGHGDPSSNPGQVCLHFTKR